jgi:hypothetical protein
MTDRPIQNVTAEPLAGSVCVCGPLLSICTARRRLERLDAEIFSPEIPHAEMATSHDGPKIPCVKLTRPDLDDGRTSCIFEMRQFSAAEEFAGAEIGEKLLLEYTEMTREEIDALPRIRGMVMGIQPGQARGKGALVHAGLTWSRRRAGEPL